MSVNHFSKEDEKLIMKQVDKMLDKCTTIEDFAKCRQIIIDAAREYIAENIIQKPQHLWNERDWELYLRIGNHAEKLLK